MGRLTIPEWVPRSTESLGYGYGYGYGDGFGSGYGYGDGYGDGFGSGYGYGSGYRYPIARRGYLISIGCETHFLDKWLGDVGQRVAEKHEISQTTIAHLRAQFEYWQ